MNRDVPLDTLHSEEGEECLWARGFSPVDGVLLKELVEERLAHLLEELPTMLRQIIRLLLEGAMAVDIAMRMGVEPKRVYRAMDWLKKKIREGSADGLGDRLRLPVRLCSSVARNATAWSVYGSPGSSGPVVVACERMKKKGIG